MVFDWFKRLFKKKRIDATSMHSDVTASYSDVENLSSSNLPESNYSDVTAMQKKDISLEKTSLELGLAAGYTGRSIHDINSALQRIETLMVTRDWMTANYDYQKLIELLTLIKAILESHDKHTQEKFDLISTSLDRISEISEELPESSKSEIDQEIDALRRISPVLSPKMKQTLEIIKQVGEINYRDLTPKIGYKDVSSTRSLLARMNDRTREIERFDKDNEKWVRYIDANRHSDANLSLNQSNEQTDKQT